MVTTGAVAPGPPSGGGDLAELREGDERRALLGLLVRRRTGVGMAWIAERLHDTVFQQALGGDCPDRC